MIPPKILVIGHSWVLDFEKYHDLKYLGIQGARIIYASFPGASLSQLQSKVKNFLNPSFSHVMVFTLITEAFKQVDLGEGNLKLSYDVTIANDWFNLSDFVCQFQEFIQECRYLCPRGKVWLMIPPFLDLIFYNSLNIQYFPRDLKVKYHRSAEFSDKELHEQVIHTYRNLKRLEDSQQFNWEGKNVYPVMFAIQNLKEHKYTESYLSGEKLTFGKYGFLRDGYHPHKIVIQCIWEKMSDDGCFQVSEIFPAIPSFVPTESFVALEEDTLHDSVKNNKFEGISDSNRSSRFNVSVKEEREVPYENKYVSSTSTGSYTYPSTEFAPSTLTGKSEVINRNQTNTSPQIPPSKRKKEYSLSDLDEDLCLRFEKFLGYVTGYYSGKGLDISEDDIRRKIRKFL